MEKLESKKEFNKRKKSPQHGKRGPGKVQQELKEMILGALDQSGGVEYLVRQADQNPNGFMTLLGKVLPLQLHGAGKSGELVITITKAEASII